MSERILNVKVGDPLDSTLARAAQTMEALERGESPAPYFGVGFSDVGQLFAVFTPRRWDLLAALREGGPMTIAELARRLRRDYKNVHGDVEKLAEWRVVEKNDKGFVFAPYSEIVVDIRLPHGRAA
ncbi:MAG: MarR family transcriptional regulator [Telluria sp.]|nr:MarR family transcriptional regulator [Telluria sp.]